MERKMILSAVVLSFMVALPVALNAQRPRVQPVESPIVHPDRTVTFNFKAPSAKKVELSSQFIKEPQALKRDTAGVWSITLGPVEPNLYPYFFIVDSVMVGDPNNVDIFPNERFKSSLVDIPGQTPAVYAAQDVLHGEITHCYYKSKSMNELRPLVVYTPPGYCQNSKKYPVFYLISGTTDTEETWFKVGRVNFILDNLIAQNKAVPMIVVSILLPTSDGAVDGNPAAADMA